jgi:hypothetical protein
MEQILHWNLILQSFAKIVDTFLFLSKSKSNRYLREDLDVFLCMKITVGNSQPASQPHGGIFCDDTITNPDGQQTPCPYTSQWHQKSLTSLMPSTKVKFWLMCLNCYTTHAFPKFFVSSSVYVPKNPSWSKAVCSVSQQTLSFTVGVVSLPPTVGCLRLLIKYIRSCFVWVWNLVSHTKGRAQAEGVLRTGFWKNIWT